MEQPFLAGIKGTRSKCDPLPIGKKWGLQPPQTGLLFPRNGEPYSEKVGNPGATGYEEWG